MIHPNSSSIQILSAVVPVDVVDNEDVIHEVSPSLSHFPIHPFQLSIVMERLAKLGWVEVKEEESEKERGEVYRVPRIVHEFLVKKVEESEINEKKKQLMKGEEKMDSEEKRKIMKGWLDENKKNIHNEGADEDGLDPSRSLFLHLSLFQFSHVPRQSSSIPLLMGTRISVILYFPSIVFCKYLSISIMYSFVILLILL